MCGNLYCCNGIGTIKDLKSNTIRFAERLTATVFVQRFVLCHAFGRKIILFKKTNKRKTRLLFYFRDEFFFRSPSRFLCLDFFFSLRRSTNFMQLNTTPRSMRTAWKSRFFFPDRFMMR